MKIVAGVKKTVIFSMKTALLKNESGQAFVVSELVFEAVPVSVSFFGDTGTLSLRLDNGRSIILASSIMPDLGKSLLKQDSLPIFRINGKNIEGGYEVPLFVSEGAV